MSPSTTTIIIVAAIILAVILITAIVFRRRRTQQLRSDFGPEYDRAVRQAGDRRHAEAELADRRKRVEHLDIHALDAGQRERFISSWTGVQAEFVDDPKTALAHADDLVSDVMKAEGYPMGTFEQRAADLSVEHPTVVQNYRAGHDIALRHKSGQASTEDLRQAMIHFRELFSELVGGGGDAAPAAR